MKTLAILFTFVLVSCSTTDKSSYMVSCLSTNGMPLYLGPAIDLSYEAGILKFRAQDGPQTGMMLNFINMPCVYGKLPRE
jgi:hypothetical protein